MSSPSSTSYEAQVLARFEGDKELLREIAQLFLDDSPQSLEAIRAAVAARDGQTLYRTTHALKGSVSNFLSAGEMASADDPARKAATAILALEQLASSGQVDQVDPVFATAEKELAQLRRRLEQIIAS